MEAIPVQQPIGVWRVPADCDNDIHAGPFAAACDNPRFDFTLVFEHLALGAIPSAILILFALFRAYDLRNKTTKVAHSNLSGLKAVCFPLTLLL